MKASRPCMTAFTAWPYRSFTVSRTASLTVSVAAFFAVAASSQQLGPQQAFSVPSFSTVGFVIVISLALCRYFQNTRMFRAKKGRPQQQPVFPPRLQQSSQR